MDNTEELKRISRTKRIPVLILDQKWHRLFAVHGKTEQIQQAEAVLNELLKQQGRANNELKEHRKLKSQLMGNIVQNMNDYDAGTDKQLQEKKMEESKRLIDEINDKMENLEDELFELSDKIRDANEELMLLGMDYFYEKIQVNMWESRQIDEWINNVRVELKKNIIRKQNRDINNREIYAYLHDILGPDVLDLFDFQQEDDKE